jgi:glycosyltransferase involved in cell wall biosynthesis
MPKIAIVTGAHLCRNPRVIKEATALARVGHKVAVLSPLIEDELLVADMEILANAPFSRITSVDARASQRIRSVMTRGLRRVAHEANVWLGLQRPEALGYGIRTALRRAIEMDADYYIGHQETGAWVCWKLLQGGKRVGVDLEDWYSRFTSTGRRSGRPRSLLDRIERDLVRRAVHVTTTSNAMADEMERSYGRRPGVVYNSFPWTDRGAMDGKNKDRSDFSTPSLVWFSQTVGPGRGLECLVESLNLLSSPVQLHLRGNVTTSYRTSLTARLKPNSKHTLVFHPAVAPSELLSRVAEHDIGLALEPTSTNNGDLTISNKILQYLQGGLAVVATNTKGQKEVANLARGAVCLVDHSDRDLADAIEALTTQRGLLDDRKRCALDAAKNHFAWERQEEVLVELVEDAISRGARQGAMIQASHIRH